MKLQHQTEVAASPEKVWDFLQDTRAVVQCLPGAELLEELGDDRYQGVLRVAVGPLKMNYAGDVSVVERNAAERQIVLDAGGRDKRGSGAVQAHVRLRVEPGEQGARIDVVSDLDLTGRIASLGRGVRDVSNKMFVDFAARLAAQIESPVAAPVGAGAPAAPAAASVGAARTAAPAAPAASGASGASGGGAATAQAVAASSEGGEIKVLPLVWNVTRERFADFLERMSARVRPR